MSHIGTGADVSFNPVEAAHDMNVAVAARKSSIERNLICFILFYFLWLLIGRKGRMIVLFCGNYGRNGCAKSRRELCQNLTSDMQTGDSQGFPLNAFPTPLFGMSVSSCRIFS